MPELNRTTVLYAPPLTMLDRGGWTVCVDAEAPNWVSTDARGAWMLETLNGSPSDFASLVARYAAYASLDSGDRKSVV